MNTVILCLHVATICGITLGALRFGKEVMSAWLSLLCVVMNLFVLKQITLFGLSVTSSDAFGVGYLLGLNLMQEYYGKKEARQCIWISFFISCSFLVLSQFHLLYTPNQFDLAHPHFVFLLSPMPRIVLASLSSFLLIQLVDLTFFGFLRSEGKHLVVSTLLALILSQTLDTVLFSFLGLYGIVASISHVIYLSLAIKGIVILLSLPFVSWSKKVLAHVSL